MRENADRALMCLQEMYHKYFKLSEMARHGGVPQELINRGMESYEALFVEVRDLIYLWIEEEKKSQARSKRLFEE
jgi:hypothetical protein